MWHHHENSALRATSYRHTYMSQIFFWFTINAFLKRPFLLKYWLLRPFSMRKPHAKDSTEKGLLSAPDHEESKKRTLSDQPQLSRITSTALLCRWGRQSLKDMMSLGTDFEMHAIWQGYVEDPAAKDFIARKCPHYCFEQSMRKLS
jgi:hypothetical protein